MRLTIGGVRLTSGLVLFVYVLVHSINHALGNVSLAAMERGLQIAGAFWSMRPVQIVLYGAFAAHLGLGLWALYQRRPFRYRLGEAAQMGLGLLIPYLLFEHIVATRLGQELYGFRGAYAPMLHNFFVVAPWSGVRQAFTLLVVWLHGCLGLYYWLRLKPFFPRMSPLLLGLAVLVPTLSLLGYWQGGREVIRLAADPAWRPPSIGEVPPGAFTTLSQVEGRSGTIWVSLFAARA